MINVHFWDAQGIYTHSAEYDPMDLIPPQGTLKAPPELSGNEVAQWSGTGWTVLPERPPLPPEPAPDSCTRRQGRLALLGVGKLDLVEATIDAISDPAQRRAAQIEYEADTWERCNAFLQAMWAQLGGTPEQLDDLFREAATL